MVLVPFRLTCRHGYYYLVPDSSVLDVKQ